LYFSTSPNEEGIEILSQLIFYNVQGFKSVLKRTVQARGKVFWTFRDQRRLCSNRSTKMFSKPSINPHCERNEVGGFRILRLTLLKPSFFLRTTRLNIQNFYMVLALRWVFFYGYQNRQRLLLYTSLTEWFL
jgi:hypothetical protein